MKQEYFTQKGEQSWQQLEELLAKENTDLQTSDFPRIYPIAIPALQQSSDRAPE